MEFRKSNMTDLPAVMKIIRQAQEYMRENRLDQWQDGYPDENQIKDDIVKGCGYVLLDGTVTAGTAAIFFDGETSYDRIYQGQWLTEGEYAAVHRVAVSSAYRNKGAAVTMMKHIEKLCLKRGVYSIKIDTHEDNRPMRRFLEKCGFIYCGVIYLNDGSKRLAYEKILK
jgi:GNAT superfamily N-acetyltransferase